jgi:hypothetical protein
MRTLLAFLCCCNVATAQISSKQYLPENKDFKAIGDTSWITTSYDSTGCVVYVIKCDTCEVLTQAALKIKVRHTQYQAYIIINKKTKERMIGDAMGSFMGDGRRFVKYIRYNKTEFDKSWTIIKEKE